MLTQTHRPFTFDGVIGQPGIIKEMKKRSKKMDFPEVMIFEGESGCGKSTLARIISALINDPSPIVNKDGTKDPNPESPDSKSILEEKFNRDVVHYDASSMGKDDVINLGKSVNSAPMFSKNRVIIIDEAQELSKAGKGVTLDLLEKKRRGTYFILCTMNINSFDKAVRSRGQVYKFKSPSDEDVAKLLFDLAEKLEIPLNEETEEFYSDVLFTLAENCEGSVRMAIQNFERCVYGKIFTLEDLQKEFLFISKDRLTNLIVDLLKCEKSVIEEIKKFDSKEFYYKCQKTLHEAFTYKKTGYISAKWKIGLANQLDEKDIEKLLEYFIEVDKHSYFKEDVFFFYISKFFDSKEVPKRKPQRVPIKG